MPVVVVQSVEKRIVFRTLLCGGLQPLQFASDEKTNKQLTLELLVGKLEILVRHEVGLDVLEGLFQNPEGPDVGGLRSAREPHVGFFERGAGPHEAILGFGAPALLGRPEGGWRRKGGQGGIVVVVVPAREQSLVFLESFLDPSARRKRDSLL